MTKQKATPNTLYVYILVRRDLTPSQQVVQASHAAMLAARNLIPPESPDTPHLVVCGVTDEAALVAEHERLVRSCVPVTPYFEPDFGDAMTAVATGPLVSVQRAPLRGLRLL